MTPTATDRGGSFCCKPAGRRVFMYLVASGPNIPAVSFCCLSPDTPVVKDPGHPERCTTCRFHRGLSSTLRSMLGRTSPLPGSSIRLADARCDQLAAGRPRA